MGQSCEILVLSCTFLTFSCSQKSERMVKQTEGSQFNMSSRPWSEEHTQTSTFRVAVFFVISVYFGSACPLARVRQGGFL